MLKVFIGKTIADITQPVTEDNSEVAQQQPIQQGQFQDQGNPGFNNQVRGRGGQRGQLHTRGRGQVHGRGQTSNRGHMNNVQGQPISVVGQNQQNIGIVSVVKRGQGRGGNVRGRGQKMPNFGQLQQVHIEENIDYETYNSVTSVQSQSNRTVLPSQGPMNYMGAASQNQESNRTVVASDQPRVSIYSFAR